MKIDKVGITNLKHQICIVWNGKAVITPAIFNVWVELPNNYRAIHMSRNLEALKEILWDKNARTFIQHDLYDICPKVASELLRLQEYTKRAFISIDFDLFIERLSPERKYANSEPYKIRLSSLATKTDKKVKMNHSLEVIVEGTTTCPCAQNQSKFRSLDHFAAQGINLSEKVIDNLIFHTHMQRAVITIKLNKLSKITNGIENLIDLAEDSLSNGTQGLLKRDDEEALIRQAFLNPRFVEDVVRNAAYKLAVFPIKLPRKAEVYISAETQESIHKHNAFAELCTTIDEIGNHKSLE
jgi:GTP cyclohydrolase-4